MLRSQDHIFGLNLIAVGLGLSLMKYWSQSHRRWSRSLLSRHTYCIDAKVSCLIMLHIVSAVLHNRHTLDNRN